MVMYCAKMVVSLVEPGQVKRDRRVEQCAGIKFQIKTNRKNYW